MLLSVLLRLLGRLVRTKLLAARFTARLGLQLSHRMLSYTLDEHRPKGFGEFAQEMGRPRLGSLVGAGDSLGDLERATGGSRIPSGCVSCAIIRGNWRIQLFHIVDEFYTASGGRSSSSSRTWLVSGTQVRRHVGHLYRIQRF